MVLEALEAGLSRYSHFLLGSLLRCTLPSPRNIFSAGASHGTRHCVGTTTGIDVCSQLASPSTIIHGEQEHVAYRYGFGSGQNSPMGFCALPSTRDSGRYAAHDHHIERLETPPFPPNLQNWLLYESNREVVPTTQRRALMTSYK